MRDRARRVWMVVLLAVAARAAVAHDTWILPERFVLPAAKTIACEMTSGMAFPRLESAIERSRVERAEVRLAGASRNLGERRTENHALAFLVPLKAAGVATVGVVLTPRSLDLTPAQVAEYLEEIGAPESVRAARAAAPGARWHETYRKQAKTYVRVGEAADEGWREPFGFALELVPQADPTRLAAGGTLAVRLLRDGKPAAGLAVGMVRAGEKSGSLQTTDADGRVTLAFARRGRYLLRATELRPEDATGETWSSDFTTLTLEVR